MNSPLSLGTWLSIGSPVIADLAALCGFDWVLIDLEHGNAAESAVPDQLRALRGSRTRGIVRVGAPHADLMGRLLDWGAHGIMVPHVNSAGEAARIVQATRYPPGGHRGYSRTVRANDFGLRPLEDVPPPILMAQIESIEGVQQAREIAKVEGIEVLFVGPADLQLDLKHRAGSAPGDFLHCLDLVSSAARDAGKEAGILLRDAAEISRHFALGFTCIAVDSDTAILRKAYQQTLSMKSQLPPGNLNPHS